MGASRGGGRRAEGTCGDARVRGRAWGRTLRTRCAEGPESRILRTCAAAATEPRGDADSASRWM